jgi:hypothetical protein
LVQHQVQTGSSYNFRVTARVNAQPTLTSQTSATTIKAFFKPAAPTVLVYNAATTTSTVVSPQIVLGWTAPSNNHGDSSITYTV